MSIEKMVAIEMAFRDAYEHTTSQFPDASRKEPIAKFIAGIAMQYSTYLSFTSDGLNQLMGDVFHNPVVRDFVFRLTNAFQIRLGQTRQTQAELPDILTGAMCLFPNPTLHSEVNVSSDKVTIAIPQDIQDRLPSYEDVHLLLSSNKWMVTICMLSLYVRIESTPSKTPAKA